ncbi:MAG: TFIIB-type zinc ribbon-containing protein [Lachnospiraceae bacterium]|nr:TFIIB-type zinc ribbon-containing protein [Lachnospiraceae bacterium]
MDLIQYKCPNCGGPLKFDPKTGTHTCEYCRGSFTQAEMDKITDSKEQAGDNAGPASYTSDADQTGDVSGSKVYTCPSCGATIVTDETTAATFCYYCHNPIVLSGRLSGEDKPDYVIPFKISRDKALEIFEKWISRKKYVPKAFYDKKQIEKFTGVYFPYLMYTCNVSGNIDTDAIRTKVYTDGAYETTERSKYHVVRSGDMKVTHVFRNALKKANKVLADGVLPFDYNDDGMQPFNMSYLSGFFAEKRDIESGDMQDEMRQEVKDYAVSQLKSAVAEYGDINVNEDNITVDGEKWEYALMPVWTLTYNDGGRIYYFSINGQTGKTIGELPVDKGRLIRTFLLIFIPVFIALLALFYFVF